MPALTHRARDLLVAYGKRYPDAWRQFDRFRDDRQALGGWPDTVFCPLAGAYALVSGGGDARVPLAQIGEVARLAALAAWRPTQGIFRFDPDLLAALWTSPLSGDLPCALLRYLPAWCVYIELGAAQRAQGVHGIFAHLEYDTNDGAEELRLLIDTDTELLPLPLPLGPWTLAEALERMAAKAQPHAQRLGLPPLYTHIDPAATAWLEPLVSLVLYLCSAEADYVRPPLPVARQTKRGPRLFPPEQPQAWAVGVRIGAALRAGAPAARDDTGTAAGTGSRPRPHLRRAHWHGFWSGPLSGERTFKVKWLPPIPVNLAPGADLPAVVHPVRAPLARD